MCDAYLLPKFSGAIKCHFSSVAEVHGHDNNQGRTLTSPKVEIRGKLLLGSLATVNNYELLLLRCPAAELLLGT
jgi:hypothetical protein